MGDLDLFLYAEYESTFVVSLTHIVSEKAIFNFVFLNTLPLNLFILDIYVAHCSSPFPKKKLISILHGH